MYAVQAYQLSYITFNPAYITDFCMGVYILKLASVILRKFLF